VTELVRCAMRDRGAIYTSLKRSRKETGHVGHRALWAASGILWLGAIRTRRTMHERCLSLVLLASVLTNCASRFDIPPSQVAWDGRVQPNAMSYRARTSYAASGPANQDPRYDEELAKYRAYSDEWWAVKQAADDREVARLAKILNICRGC
jgi:hypothetical protein